MFINLYRTVVMVMSLISDGEAEVVKDKKGLNGRIVFVSATLLVLLFFGVRRCNLRITDPAALDSSEISQAMQTSKEPQAKRHRMRHTQRRSGDVRGRYSQRDQKKPP